MIEGAAEQGGYLSREPLDNNMLHNHIAPLAQSTTVTPQRAEPIPDRVHLHEVEV